MASRIKEFLETASGNGHAKVATAERKVAIQVKALKEGLLYCRIVGTAPYMQQAFSMKQQLKMKGKQEEGPTGKGKKVREKRDFKANYEEATHWMLDGKGRKVPGISCCAIRSAMVSACRTTDLKMTFAKQAILGVIPDGHEIETNLPLFKIIGKREMNIAPARNTNGGMDLRSRPLWRQWHADIVIRYDADMMTETDIANLLYRAGQQVGIGEGRPDSRDCCGIGFGLFRVEGR